MYKGRGIDFYNYDLFIKRTKGCVFLDVCIEGGRKV